MKKIMNIGKRAYMMLQPRRCLLITFIGAFLIYTAMPMRADEVIYDPIQTPIYVGTTLFCSKIVYGMDEKPCDPESRLVVYSANVEDTVRGVLNFRIYFDIMSANANKELIVKDIKDIEIVRCDQSEFNANTFIPIFHQELSGWHWWLGDYLNPLTMYPQQIWTVKYIIIPKHQEKI